MKLHAARINRQLAVLAISKARVQLVVNDASPCSGDDVRGMECRRPELGARKPSARTVSEAADPLRTLPGRLDQEIEAEHDSAEARRAVGQPTEIRHDTRRDGYTDSYHYLPTLFPPRPAGVVEGFASAAGSRRRLRFRKNTPARSAPSCTHTPHTPSWPPDGAYDRAVEGTAFCGASDWPTLPRQQWP